MSKQAVIEFLDRLASDDDLRQRVANTLDESQRDPDVILSVADGLGLDFTLDELDQALTERHGSPSGELSDTELENVAGGGATVINVNSQWVTHRGSGGIATGFPNVCHTPTLPGGGPIPYPNIGTSSDVSKGTKDTKN